MGGLHHHGRGHGHAHHDHHEADHGHHHAHSHAAGGDFGRAFAIGTALNLGFVIVEALYGLVAGSMALLADAGHNLGDVFGLLLAWGATVLSRRRPDARFTYGLRSSSIVAALLNALLLLVAVALIAIEAVRRLADPAPVPGATVMIVAGIGIVINGATALMFARGRKGDINIRGAYLHMAADAGVSAAVVLAGLLITLTGMSWIDSATSLVIAAVIAFGTWGLLRDAVAMSLHAVPPGIDSSAIRTFLEGRPGVAAVHDLHVWPMSTTETALTAHLLIPAGFPGDAFIAQVADSLHERFGIDHTTIQIETDPEARCRLEPDHLV